MFFKYNSALGPPYNIIVDTNFINFSIKNKLEVVSAMMDCLLAKCKCFFRHDGVASPVVLCRLIAHWQPLWYTLFGLVQAFRASPTA